MRTDDIANAFRAIVEEAQGLQSRDLPEDVQSAVKTIISIAKHQNDIRQSRKGSCKAEP
ncbi:MAG: hypothetical protein PVJ53_17010 [Desulfobacterales bacterium]|jgi:hypothetical protein